MARRTEEERMLAGEMYSALDPDLVAMRATSTRLCRKFNSAEDEADQRRIMKELFGAVGDEVFIMGPMRADYGKNVYIGDKVFANFNFTLLDTCRITIGSNVLFGPNVSLFTAMHPLDPAIRRDWGPEMGKPITASRSAPVLPSAPVASSPRTSSPILW
ncbi:hypothetical protein HDU89_003838 [Geranomyces variabilis]|nr:hypothetical protein HDU89_003838 [Geranomyces variabilis]